MDMFLLLVAMCVFFAIGMPISYALALSSLVGAWWIDIPLEAVMLKISDGVSKFAMLTIPFFVLAGAIMAEGGMARRLVAFANVLVGFFRIRGRVPNRLSGKSQRSRNRAEKRLVGFVAGVFAYDDNAVVADHPRLTFLHAA